MSSRGRHMIEVCQEGKMYGSEEKTREGEGRGTKGAYLAGNSPFLQKGNDEILLCVSRSDEASPWQHSTHAQPSLLLTAHPICQKFI